MSLDDRRVVLLLLGLAVLAGAAGTVSADLGRGVVGLLALVVIAVVAFDSRRLTLQVLIAWLVLLGFVRRALIPFAGWSEVDPLLLVGPAAAAILLVTLRDEAPSARTVLGSLMTFQLLWVLVCVFHPNEPSPGSALRGVIFFLTPLLWFFVGRKISGADHDRVFAILPWLGIPVVALGLYHTFVGLLSFELTWLGLADVHPAVIFVGGFNIRPFSTLASPQEYGLTLAIVLLVLWCRWLYGHRGTWQAAAMSVVAVALFLQGSRGILLSSTFGLAMVWAVKRRSPVVLLMSMSILFIAVFLASAGADVAVDTEEVGGDDTTGALVRHQISGITDPSNSTLGLHIRLYIEGFEQGIDNPIGLGPTKNRHEGSITLDDQEYQYSPEGELAITLIALGFPAALALIGIYIAALRYAWGLQRAEPSVRHLVWFGLLLVTGDQMLNGRLYLVSVLVALSMGGMAREWAARRTAAVAVPVG